MAVRRLLSLVIVCFTLPYSVAYELPVKPFHSTLADNQKITAFCHIEPGIDASTIPFNTDRQHFSIESKLGQATNLLMRAETKNFALKKILLNVSDILKKLHKTILWLKEEHFTI